MVLDRGFSEAQYLNEIEQLESERELLANALMLLVKNDMLPADDMDTVVDAMRLAREILKTKPNEGSV